MRLNTDSVDIIMYQIERRFDKHWSVIEPSAVELGEDPKWPQGGGGKAVAPYAYEFSACGECWQKTGEFGTFDKIIAQRAITSMALNATNTYRIVERHWQIKTKELIKINGNDF